MSKARHAQRSGTTDINVSKKIDKITEILINPVLSSIVAHLSKSAQSELL